MKITIESTTRIVNVRAPGSDLGIPCRVWEGKTERGVQVQCLVPRIAAAAEGPDLSEFEAELQEHRAPSAEAQAFPLRMII